MEIYPDGLTPEGNCFATFHPYNFGECQIKAAKLSWILPATMPGAKAGIRPQDKCMTVIDTLTPVYISLHFSDLKWEPFERTQRAH